MGNETKLPKLETTRIVGFRCPPVGSNGRRCTAESFKEMRERGAEMNRLIFTDKKFAATMEGRSDYESIRRDSAAARTVAMNNLQTEDLAKSLIKAKWVKAVKSSAAIIPKGGRDDANWFLCALITIFTARSKNRELA